MPRRVGRASTEGLPKKRHLTRSSKARQGGQRIRRRLRGTGRDVDIAQPGEHRADRRDLIGRIARLVAPGWRDIGRIGFEHDRFERQLHGKATDLFRALERDIAAETELETLREKSIGLLEAAVESVRDPVTDAEAAPIP